jgi:hypothetical protein
MGFGRLEVAFPARYLAEAQLREDLAGLVVLPGRQAQGPFEELASLGQVTGSQRAAAQPRQGVGRLRPQAEVFGHAQAVPVQLAGLRQVPGGRRGGAEPFGGLQLPPAVAELAEYHQALLGVAARGGRVAADHRQLGAGTQGRRDAPPVTERAEARQRLADRGLGHGRVVEVGGDERAEPLQRGPDDRVVDAVGARRGHGFPGENRETAAPGQPAVEPAAGSWPRARASSSARLACVSRPRRNQYQARALTIRRAAPASPSWTAEPSELRRLAVSASRRLSQDRWS